MYLMAFKNQYVLMEKILYKFLASSKQRLMSNTM